MGKLTKRRRWGGTRQLTDGAATADLEPSSAGKRDREGDDSRGQVADDHDVFGVRGRGWRHRGQLSRLIAWVEGEARLATGHG